MPRRSAPPVTQQYDRRTFWGRQSLSHLSLNNAASSPASKNSPPRSRKPTVYERNHRRRPTRYYPPKSPSYSLMDRNEDGRMAILVITSLMIVMKLLRRRLKIRPEILFC